MVIQPVFSTLSVLKKKKKFKFKVQQQFFSSAAKDRFSYDARLIQSTISFRTVFLLSLSGPSALGKQHMFFVFCFFKRNTFIKEIQVKRVLLGRMHFKSVGSLCLPFLCVCINLNLFILMVLYGNTINQGVFFHCPLDVQGEVEATERRDV